MKILLVDDNDFVRQVIAKMLREESHDITECDNGRTAISRFIEEDFDIVITDIMMPERNGLELTEHVKNTNKNIPVIAISGDRVDSKELNSPLNMAKYFADEILAKPIKKQELLAAIESARLKNIET